MTLYVNLYGGPGSGKSTLAAYVFSKVKFAGVNAELVTEYAKDRVWLQDVNVLRDQLYVFGKQHHRLWRLQGKVEVVVTDSPLLMSLVYGADESPEFRDLVRKCYDQFENLNVMVAREKTYNPAGRLQTEEEAMSLDDEVAKVVDGVLDMTVTGNEEGADSLIAEVLAYLS